MKETLAIKKEEGERQQINRQQRNGQQNKMEGVSTSNDFLIPSPSRSLLPHHSNHGIIMSPASSSKTNNINTDGIHTLLDERMAEGGGALCNDQNGLCLGYEGSIDASKSGIYTSIAKLASLLDNTIDGPSSSSANKSNMKKGNNEVPLISIQTDQATLLVKEYGGRTIVFRVPAEVEDGRSATVGGSGEGGIDLNNIVNHAIVIGDNNGSHAVGGGDA